MVGHYFEPSAVSAYKKHHIKIITIIPNYSNYWGLYLKVLFLRQEFKAFKYLNN